MFTRKLLKIMQSKMKINKKLLLFLLLGMLVALYLYMRNLSAEPDRNIVWGLTFSSKFSRQLNGDSQKNFKTILEELKPKTVRLVVYWDEIEKDRGIFDFSDIDWQINEAEKYDVDVILTVGMKVPRWPECHAPNWAKEISVEKREEYLGEYIKKVVERYKNSGAVYAWQVENEPFLPFGECSERGENFLSSEIALVKSIDADHPIIITDSGEVGLWYKAARLGDIFGTTMYRRVYNDFLGQIDYHLSPRFFILKEKIVRFLTGNQSKKFIVVELAMEPWLKKQLYETTMEEQFKFFDLEFFKDTITYAKATGFDEYYLWGAEWWYYLKVNGHPEIWEEAKKLWQ